MTGRRGAAPWEINSIRAFTGRKTHEDARRLPSMRWLPFQSCRSLTSPLST